MITINKMYRVIFIKNISVIQNSALNSFKQTQKFSMAFTLGGMIHHYRIEIAFVSVTQLNWVKTIHDRGQ